MLMILKLKKCKTKFKYYINRKRTANNLPITLKSVWFCNKKAIHFPCKNKYTARRLPSGAIPVGYGKLSVCRFARQAVLLSVQFQSTKASCPSAGSLGKLSFFQCNSRHLRTHWELILATSALSERLCSEVIISVIASPTSRFSVEAEHPEESDIIQSQERVVRLLGTQGRWALCAEMKTIRFVVVATEMV